MMNQGAKIHNLLCCPPKYAIQIWPTHIWFVLLIDIQLREVPKSIKAAMTDLNQVNAMLEEMNTLLLNHTSELVPPCVRQNVVGCQRIFHLKGRADRSIDHYKAYLVAKGFYQCQGQDFDLTYSLVAKAPTIRIVLAVIVSHRWPLHHLDV